MNNVSTGWYVVTGLVVCDWAGGPWLGWWAVTELVAVTGLVSYGMHTKSSLKVFTAVGWVYTQIFRTQV